MEFSTKEIETIARQFANLITKQLDLEEGMPIGQLEKTMQKQLQRMGQMALGKVLTQADHHVERKIPCQCGGTLQYQRRRKAKVRSVFDWVTYERSYYAGCECGEGKAPLDQRFGLEPGSVTAGLASLMAMTGVELPFEHSSQFLERFLFFRLAGNTVRKETQCFGRLQRQREAKWIQEYDDDQFLLERERLHQEKPERIYGSIDGAFVRIEEREKSPEPIEKWREMKVGCWYQAEKVPGFRKGKPDQVTAKIGHQALRAKDIRYYCQLDTVEQFEPLFWATSCRAQADLAQEVVFICDGAKWIWKLVETHYPDALQIVDWYHAEERLEKAADDVFEQTEQASAWLEQVKEALWHGRTDYVIRACQRFAHRSEKARQATTYFRNNAHRMHYDRYREQGYLIGSGTVESGCKQIVTQRLKCAGAQWTVEGANLTAKARAAWLSDQWDDLCSRRDLLPLAA